MDNDQYQVGHLWIPAGHHVSRLLDYISKLGK